MSDWLADRIRRAEKQMVKDRYRPKDDRKWLEAPCPHCSYMVSYSPKEDFNGDLKCSSCGKVFHISRLSDFFSE